MRTIRAIDSIDESILRKYRVCVFLSSLVTLIFIFLSQFLPRAFTSINIIIALNAFARIHATLHFHVLDNSYSEIKSRSA